MTRSALIPSPGDPFVVSYWLRNCERVWRQEVDEVILVVNGQGSDEVYDFIRAEAARVDVTVYRRASRSHAESLDYALQRSSGGVTVLLEDDAYVRDPAELAACFHDIEEGRCDIIGSPRGGMSPAVAAAAHEKWGPIEYPNAGEGHGLWPCFLFADRDTLLRARHLFGARTWRQGECIPGLGLEVLGREETTDTLTAAAFVWRNLGFDIRPCVQHKELWHKTLPPDGAPWFHVGGLSNGDFVSESWDGGGARANVGGSLEGLDWAHRIWWWRRCLDTSWDVLPHLRGPYRERLDALTAWLDVEQEVEEWDEKLLPWVNWRDGE